MRKRSILLASMLCSFLFSVSFLLAGCSTPVDPVSATTPTILTTVPSIVRTESTKVGSLYHDSHPTVTKVVSDVTDGPQSKPMYRVTLKGHFVRKGLTYSSIAYSMLTDGSQVWSVSDGSTWDDENISLTPPAKTNTGLVTWKYPANQIQQAMITADAHFNTFYLPTQIRKGDTYQGVEFHGATGVVHFADMTLMESEGPLKPAGKVVNQVEVTLYDSLDKGIIYTLANGSTVIGMHRGTCNLLLEGSALTDWQLELVMGSVAPLNG